MKIRSYLYNTFVIFSGNKKIVIDPGAELYLFRFNSILPESEWNDVTHIFITHGDPDHYWHTDRIAVKSGAKIICRSNMIRKIKGKNLMLGPRSKGLTFDLAFDNVQTIDIDGVVNLDGMCITGIYSEHGPITFKFGPFSKKLKPGPYERIGHGAIGYKIETDGKTIVNLGDTMLLEDEWKSIVSPDVLMIPIGGEIPENTMNESEALRAIEIMKPKMVIPTHYNLPDFFHRRYNTADDQWFKSEVEKMGIKCMIMKHGEAIDV